MKQITLAVIGSRETIEETMQQMGQAAAAFTRAALKAGFAVQWESGGCWKGPDQILFLLADIFKNDNRVSFRVFLPDDKKMWLKTRHPHVMFHVPDITESVREKVKELHAAPDNLKEEHFKLHGRNLFIIAGPKLETPVDACYFAAPENTDGKVSGGTAMGVAYARQRNIPCFNAFTQKGTDAFIQFGRKYIDS